MELRHLCCFLAVAEALHFARAAQRLYIEQSPLSRTIKELEEDLGVLLFNRTTRSTRLTRAGRPFLGNVPRVFMALEQAGDSVKAAAAGFQEQLRAARKERKFTAQEVADRAAISRGLLQRIEKGDLKCEIGAVFEVATIVGVKLFDVDDAALAKHLRQTEEKLALLPKSVRRKTSVVHDDF